MLKKIKYFLLFLFILSNATAQIDGIPDVPNPPRLVNDYVGLLSSQQRDDLEQKLVAFDDSTGTQIAIVIVASLGSYDKAEFAYTLGKKWGIGHEKNNGLVILMKPKTIGEKGQVFIAPGKGLEGAIPDIIAKRIVENELIPAFKQNDFYLGLSNATNTIMALASGDYKAEDYVKKKQKQGNPIVLIIVVLLILMLFNLIKRKAQNSITMGHKPNLWTILWLMSQSSGRHSGRYGDFNSGSGDFGGFGGGSFGGGGAGGDW